MQEEWKDVKGYEGYYQVSNLGRVRSLDRIVRHSGELERTQCGKTLKPQVNKRNGYIQIGLHKQGHNKLHKIHRLVAIAFIPNMLNKPEVNHLDEKKGNNTMTNLEWCTKLENEHWGTKHERSMRNTDYKAIAKKNAKKVLQLDKEHNTVREWESLAHIQRELGYSNGNISMCCNGIYKKPLYGYYWKFKEAS